MASRRPGQATLIAEAGETLLPETEAFAQETDVAEDTSEGFSLNVLRYALRAQSAWKQAVAAFEEVSLPALAHHQRSV